jgi:hypothetical protein
LGMGFSCNSQVDLILTRARVRRNDYWKSSYDFLRFSSIIEMSLRDIAGLEVSNLKGIILW